MGWINEMKNAKKSCDAATLRLIQILLVFALRLLHRTISSLLVIVPRMSSACEDLAASLTGYSAFQKTGYPAFSITGYPACHILYPARYRVQKRPDYPTGYPVRPSSC